MLNTIPIEVKKTCCQMKDEGWSSRAIYDSYFKQQFDKPCKYESFKRNLRKWSNTDFPDELTLSRGTYEGFTAHGATVQVSKDGEIVQAWIKQKANEVDPEDFIRAIRDSVEPYEYKPQSDTCGTRMLEIPLFDMHWGIAFMDHYQPVLDEILEIIYSHRWGKITIPFGQDFFHNDSIVNGITTKGTAIEKVDMVKAVKDGQKFMYAIIDAALENADCVKVLYSPGNHDKSISWMFMQVLLERYGQTIVDDSLKNRKVILYGDNAIMVTHGESKQSTAKNLAHMFPIEFPFEFSEATTREVHAGHLHREGEADIYGIMVRRLSTGGKVDEWSDKEGYIGSHRRFMLFDWSLDKLKAIYYV